MFGLTMPTNLHIEDVCDLKEDDWVRLVAVGQLVRDKPDRKLRHGEVLRTDRLDLVWICPKEEVTVGSGPFPILIVAINKNSFGAISIGYAGRIPISDLEEWLREKAEQNSIRLY